MFVAFLAITLLTAAANATVAILDLKHADISLATSKSVDVPESWLNPLGLLKLAGALGLVIGIWVPPLGIAAAVGLVLFFVGAFIAHLRAGQIGTIHFPSTFLVLAIASLLLRLATL